MQNTEKTIRREVKEIQDLITKINALIDEEYESAKAKSATYGELKESLEKIESGIAWSHMENAAEIAVYAGKRFRKALNEELEGVQLGKSSTEIENQNDQPMLVLDDDAKILYSCLNMEEQQKARRIIISLEGLNVESARQILGFCKETIKTNAQVKVLG